ncbi:hypothetical protein OAN58_00415 [Paracoccaceae bacterium]|nr:hypothetical protein [Paracoccaceae bacterium]
MKNTPCPVPRPTASNLPYKAATPISLQNAASADQRQSAAYRSNERQKTKERTKFIYG